MLRVTGIYGLLVSIMHIFFPLVAPRTHLDTVFWTRRISIDLGLAKEKVIKEHCQSAGFPHIGHVCEMRGSCMTQNPLKGTNRLSSHYKTVLQHLLLDELINSIIFCRNLTLLVPDIAFRYWQCTQWFIMSHLQASKLFSIQGCVAVVTGAGSGESPRRYLPLYVKCVVVSSPPLELDCVRRF
jgi:hypothetical protein